MQLISTSGIVYMNEHHVVVDGQDGIELLMSNRGQLGHVPDSPLIHGHVDFPHRALIDKNRSVMLLYRTFQIY